MKNRGQVSEWLGRAREDRNSALFLLEKMHPIPCEVVCYLCQQAAEKIPKSLLFASEQPLLKSHDLTRIAEQLATVLPVDDEILRACAVLTPYSTSSRYPSMLEIDDIRTAHTVSQMNVIFCWAEAVLAGL